jgi:hypothetical protein
MADINLFNIEERDTGSHPTVYRSGTEIEHQRLSGYFYDIAGSTAAHVR